MRCLGSTGFHYDVKWLPPDPSLQEMAGVGILSSPWESEALGTEQCTSGCKHHSGSVLESKYSQGALPPRLTGIPLLGTPDSFMVEEGFNLNQCPIFPLAWIRAGSIHFRKTKTHQGEGMSGWGWGEPGPWFLWQPEGSKEEHTQWSRPPLPAAGSSAPHAASPQEDDC